MFGILEKSSKYLLLVMLVFILLVFSSCSSGISEIDVNNEDNALDENLPSYKLTIEEEAYINELRQTGLKIATPLSSEFCIKSNSYEYFGFNCDFAYALGNFYDIDITLLDMPSYSELFTVNDVVYNIDNIESLEWTLPDICNSYDLVAHSITKLPWREEIHDFIPFLYTRMLLISDDDDDDFALRNLGDKTVYTLKSSSYDTRLLYLEDTYGYDINILYTENRDQIYDSVMSGESDFLFYDSNLAFRKLNDYPDLKVVRPVSGVQTEGWLVCKDDLMLKSIVSKFFIHTYIDGSLDDIFVRYLGVDYDNYRDVIGIGDEYDILQELE